MRKRLDIQEALGKPTKVILIRLTEKKKRAKVECNLE
jgi:uncharacterized protein YcgL (UPF0745 family)